MMQEIPNGVWPTMITPFDENNSIDYNAMERLIKWYLKQNVSGLFAVCQSSEMFFLSLEERINIARFVKEKAGSSIPVIASGHISDSIPDQIHEMREISKTGIDAFVIVTNRLATANESDEVWKSNAEVILNAVPNIVFGLYECPYPYKRLMTPDLLRWCASTGRFKFLKDTCCDLKQLEEKLDAVKGTPLKIFNANAATLLDSLKIGVSGYSGVMANFHPDLYVWLIENWSKYTDVAEEVQSFLGVMSIIERQVYPVNAKYHLILDGVDMELYSRVRSHKDLTFSNMIEVQQLHQLWQKCKKIFNIS